MKIVATLPTFNESANIIPLIKALLKVSRVMEVLVIDDNSPDGTWKLVRSMAEENPRVHLLHRTTERGRGTAGVAGFRKALEMGADLIVEMDADWSHNPRFIRPMLVASRRADVVIGSRLVPGGGETGRHGIRTLITHLANSYIRLILGLPVRDCTSGFRVFRRCVLERIDWNRVESRGPAIVQEVLMAAKAMGARFKELPILFEERRAGKSSFTTKILLAGLAAQFRLRLRPAPVRTL
ncbi:polyprenol monophosphomannose synthase [soil metagenome]